MRIKARSGAFFALRGTGHQYNLDRRIVKALGENHAVGEYLDCAGFELFENVAPRVFAHAAPDNAAGNAALLKRRRDVLRVLNRHAESDSLFPWAMLEVGFDDQPVALRDIDRCFEFLGGKVAGSRVD